MKEIWKDIPNYEGIYQISNLGSVKSKHKILKGWIQKTGYKSVCLKNKKYSVHRLVAITFIPNPNKYPIINHIDGNKLNNNVDNLEWCTYKHNWKEAVRLNLIKPNYFKKGQKIRSKKIKQYTLNGKYICTYIDSIEAEKELNKKGVKIFARNIRNVCNGKRKTTGGFIWRFDKNEFSK